MLFKHPNILYALFALLIPIIIHLFKLRKFKKTAFTNVAFLQKVTLQTRKSALLKKWLVLFTRLALFACIILAFAEPYFPSASSTSKPNHYLVYLDNSFSMQGKGDKGPLLTRAVQELITSFSENEIFTLFTNTEVYKNISLNEVQNQILDIGYTAEQLAPEHVLLKAKQLTKGHHNTALVVISDFQEKKGYDYTNITKQAKGIVQLQPQQYKNVAIDSLWISKEQNNTLLKIAASNQKHTETVSFSVYNKNNLLGRSEIDFSSKSEQIISIQLPQKKSIIGKVEIDSPDLSYDNTAYFSINSPPKAKVLSIGRGNTSFLQKIYTADEFNFNAATLSNLNYAEISEANTIVLNEIEDLPTPLQQNLINFTKNGGVLIIIPSLNSTKNTLNFIEKNYGIAISKATKVAKKVTKISFNHPIFNNVFTKKVTNFQYPIVKESFSLSGGTHSIFELEDATPFLTQQNNTFVFAAPLNKKTTNFLQSPLVVPTFYNMAQLNTALSQIAFQIGKTNIFNTNIQQGQDEVLHLINEQEEFIPLQQVFKNHVQITTTDLPKKAGNYLISSKTNSSNNSVSYNYPRTESVLSYAKLNLQLNKNYSNSVNEYFTQAKAAFETKEVWKWFLIFALFFVLIEVLLLKFLK